MKKFEMFDVKNVPLCVDVVCNRCGESCKSGYGFVHAAVQVTWGYASNKDGVSQAWDLCEKCHDEVTATFKVRPATQVAEWARGSEDDHPDLQVRLNQEVAPYPDAYAHGGFVPKEISVFAETEIIPSKSGSS